jgi:hypothetical protein
MKRQKPDDAIPQGWRPVRRCSRRASFAGVRGISGGRFLQKNLPGEAASSTLSSMRIDRLSRAFSAD